MEFLKTEIYARSTVRVKTKLPCLTMFRLQSQKGSLPQSSVPLAPANPHCFTLSAVWTCQQAERCI